MGCRELQVNDYFRMTDSASGTDVPYYALADANKNITDYFDSNGNVVAHYEYSPFGKITKKAGAMQDNFDYRFSSEVFDNETGLSYYNFRYYSAELGRWLSKDPIVENGHEINQKSNDKVTYVDKGTYSISHWANKIKKLMEMYADINKFRNPMNLISTLPLSSIIVVMERHLYKFCFNSPVDKIDYLGLLTSVDKYHKCCLKLPQEERCKCHCIYSDAYGVTERDCIKACNNCWGGGSPDAQVLCMCTCKATGTSDKVCKLICKAVNLIDKK